MAEDVYRGELVSFPGPWAFQLGKPHIILVSDQELETIANDPDAVVNLALTLTPHSESLRQICERAQRAGQRTLIVAFDHFFRQYRPGQDEPRRLTPDMPEYVALIAKISRFAQGYGLGLELSLLSPLEIGPAYTRVTGESGRWLHYRKGLRDPATGQFSVQLWRQRRWTNNKGPIDVQDAGVRVFAFQERALPGTPYRVVPPESIQEITDVAQVEVWEHTTTPLAQRVRIFGQGRTDVGPLTRVLVVQMYRTPEMDYFSPQALPYLKQLVDQYADAGVRLHGLYSDEMHIQQDWSYFGHHDHGEFAARYVSDGLANAFADRYGDQYRDFARYLIYFTRGQEDFAHDLTAKQGVMHVWGDSPQAIREAALLRARYYQLLQDGVVDLFVAAKRHAEARAGRRLEARAHATWAESPTIDRWETGRLPMARSQYEYTSNFVWSCTVHQAAAACYDYFKWGDFLTGNGNDHAEGGWLDRNYFALALACSTGMLNEVPLAYAAHWGMPSEVHERRNRLVSTFGAAGHPYWTAVQDAQHRDVDVLMLYPLDLVAVDERFGSWMSQYGYANYMTRAKLLERGTVRDGAIELAGRRFSTLVSTFEPFPTRELLDMMRQLAEQGGRVIWSGPPPVLFFDGSPALPRWCELFGVDYAAGPDEGWAAAGKQVTFLGPLAGATSQTVLTDFLVDRVYPVTPRTDTEVSATLGRQLVGTCRRLPSGGILAFLGFRPRDDQAQSLGYEARGWFEILNALGAYPPSGKFSKVNDNTEYISRTTDFLACRFPNGTVAIAPHFRTFEEGWPGGFARQDEEDRKYLARHPLPDDALRLEDFHIDGHTVSYAGRQAMAFRTDAAGTLIGFVGAHTRRIQIDGRSWEFADRELPLVAWSPVAAERRVEGGAVLQVVVHGEGAVRVPWAELPRDLTVFAEGPTPGSRGQPVVSRVEDDALVLEINPSCAGRWLWVVPAAAAQ
ncbi:MAG: hypothetical protein MUF48_16725 [Pirellulaceae bacterium]|nr:hypothetical protein [Pirellulaceae bacterium]